MKGIRDRISAMKRALIGLLGLLLAGSAFGQTAQPPKVRITTWNLESFPNGRACEAAQMLQHKLETMMFLAADSCIK
jgi:hypothetical protein